MFVILGLLILLAIFLATSRLRVPRDANAANLGLMSQQWLAEHRNARET
jgi:hypothetical protein